MFLLSLLLQSVLVTSQETVTCPSDCWYYNAVEKRCYAKKDESKCFKLQCDWNKMTLDFSSELFTAEDNEYPNPFDRDENTAIPAWNSTDKRWHVNCPLGACDMDMVSRTINNTPYLVFGFEIFLQRAKAEVGEVAILKHEPLTAKVLFECAYKEEILIKSAEFKVGPLEGSGEAIEFGDLTQGFKLNIFTDSDFSRPVGKENPLYIGAPVYVSVDWTVSTAKTIASFYLDNIDVTLPDGRILTLVKRSCYSDTFKVEMLQDKKIQESVSKFQFTSFVIGKGVKRMEYEMSATLKICAKSEQKCDAWVVKDDFQCPRSGDDAVFKYLA